MRFGPLPTAEAVGAVLAHSLTLGDARYKKGRKLTIDDVETIAAAGVERLVVAKLGAGDAPEDAAAERVLSAIAPDPAAAAMRAAAPFTGRANLFAAAAGVLLVDAALVAEINAVDEAITLATLAPHARVAPRQMLGTVKIIPYAAPESAVARVEALLAEAAAAGRAPLSVAPFRAMRASLILTQTPGMADSLVEKGADAVAARLADLGLTLAERRVTAHEAEAVTAAIEVSGGEMVLVLAASATSDRRDVAPAAIAAAGGAVERLGMPVDPGNLLVLGRLGDRPVLGLPGCVRSPKLNGADWVLERLAAGLLVGAADIAAMGVGGLLKEIPSRPQPRAGAAAIGAGARPAVSAVLLAAGGSSRMGAGRHKLLELVDGEPLIRRSATALLESGVDEVVAVLGARADEMRAALAGLPLRLVENAAWSAGMGRSIGVGLSAIAPEAQATLIALGDMPEVDARLVDRLIAGFDPAEGREILRPVGPSGQPGHPVLFGRRFFEALGALEGDMGARAVLREHAGFVVDAPVETDAGAVDLDTPEQWADWRAKTGARR